MNSSKKYEIDFNKDVSLDQVERYIRQNGWHNQNGYLRILENNEFGVWVVDIAALFAIDSYMVEAYNSDGKPVLACRIILEFHGGRSMRTGIYPALSQDRLNMVACFIWLRDYYLDIGPTAAIDKDIYYRQSIYNVKPKRSYDDEVFQNVDKNFPDQTWELSDGKSCAVSAEEKTGE